jgi:hypothetical protein
MPFDYVDYDVNNAESPEVLPRPRAVGGGRS